MPSSQFVPVPVVQTETSPAPAIVIRSDLFDPSRIEQSVLCIEVGKDRFRFLVLDTNRHGCWLEEYAFSSLLSDRPITETLSALFQQHPLLHPTDTNQAWQQVRVSLNSTSFTLIPKPLFRKEYASSYLSLVRGGALPTHEYAQAYEHSEGFYSVFNVEYALSEYLSATYPLQTITFVHQTSTLIRATAGGPPASPDGQTLWLYFEDEFVTLLSRDGEKLVYCNRFGFKNAQDLAYYVLYILEELRVDPLTVPVRLYGEITPFADTYARLSQFIRHLTIGQFPQGLTLTSDFNDLPEHRYLSLYGLALMIS